MIRVTTPDGFVLADKIILIRVTTVTTASTNPMSNFGPPESPRVAGVGGTQHLSEPEHDDDIADGGEPFCESKFYATHNLQYNVLGLVGGGSWNLDARSGGTGDLLGQPLLEFVRSLIVLP